MAAMSGPTFPTGRAAGARSRRGRTWSGSSRRARRPWATCSSTPFTPPTTQIITAPPSGAADALIRGQHRSGGWNYFIDFAGPADAQLVCDGRPQRLADGGIPALYRQCDVRRRRLVGSDAVSAAPLPRTARGEIPPRARPRDRLRPRQPISERRLAAALAARRSLSRLRRFHHLQRRRRGGEYPLPDHGATARSAKRASAAPSSGR